jgi:hypothetical protein
MSLSKLHIHVHGPWVLVCPCCLFMFMFMLYVREDVNAACPCSSCVSTCISTCTDIYINMYSICRCVCTIYIRSSLHIRTVHCTYTYMHMDIYIYIYMHTWAKWTTLILLTIFLKTLFKDGERLEGGRRLTCEK